MAVFFIKLLDMSVQACWLMLAVIFIRALLPKNIKNISTLMWAFVAVKLIVPFSIEAPFSLLPSGETLPAELLTSNTIEISSGVAAIDGYVNEHVTGNYFKGVKEPYGAFDDNMRLLGYIWLAGVVVLAALSIYGYFRLRKRLEEAIPYRAAGANVYLCDNVNSPFIFGIINPKIYLPSGIAQSDITYVIAHEKEHLRRKDHVWKLLASVTLLIHWFNPLVWISYVLFCRDIEFACDGRALKSFDMHEKKEYAEALLSCSTKGRTAFVYPLAFGEVGVKERIKSVLNYRKPAFWVIIICVIVIILVAACFLTNPVHYQNVAITIPAGSGEGPFYSDDIIVAHSNHIDILSGKGLPDTSVYLIGEDGSVTEAGYLTTGLKLNIDVEKGKSYKIGIRTSGERSESRVVYVAVKPAKLIANDIEKYKTDYIGDASKTSAIAMRLPYPAGIRYDSIEIKSDEPPYALTVNLSGKRTGTATDITESYAACAEKVFSLIGNMDRIIFNETESKEQVVFDREAQANSLPSKEMAKYIEALTGDSAYRELQSILIDFDSVNEATELVLLEAEKTDTAGERYELCLNFQKGNILHFPVLAADKDFEKGSLSWDAETMTATLRALDNAESKLIEYTYGVKLLPNGEYEVKSDSREL